MNGSVRGIVYEGWLGLGRRGWGNQNFPLYEWSAREDGREVGYGET